MRGMDAASVDAIVTDPPYGLSFMGKDWDHGVPGVHFWEAALYVAKPGTHLLAFGGTRTFHRLACAIEDAGWEIRDTIMWVYGSGFPKSHNLKGKWSGWGTALKPAWEPVIVARKPLAGTVAANVIQHGTGAINVDGCRIALNGDYKCKANGRPSQTGLGDNYDPDSANQPDTVGRWPANLIHDGSEEVVAGFPEPRVGSTATMTSRDTGTRPPPGSSTAPRRARPDQGRRVRWAASSVSHQSGMNSTVCGETRTGHVRDRFVAKSRNVHPTVKPTALMRYLCRLVTPPGGVVLDPFAGSGSTGKAAVLEGFSFIGLELNAEYVDIARARIEKERLHVVFQNTTLLGAAK
jgi:hypothetical protein